MMTVPLILGSLALSLGLSLLLTPLVRALAMRIRLVDQPDGRRKIHARTIALGGGIAVFLAGSGAAALTYLAGWCPAEAFAGRGHEFVGLLLASVFICALGVADDYGCLRGRHKLLGQIAAVLIVILSGMVIRTISLFDWHIELGLLAIPFTAFWLLGAINSLNLIDGMDGLLSSVGSIIGITLTVMAVLNGQPAVAWAGAILVGALLGFLRYNFPPATIFLGDAGSMLVGLVLGALAIQGSLKGPATVALAAPMAIFIIPIFDTSAAILRRKLTGRSLYTTDRGHMHHCLLHRGFSNGRALLYIAFFCVLAGVGALGSQLCQNELLAAATIITVVAILLVTKLFGHVELVLLEKRLSKLLPALLSRKEPSKAKEIEVRLQGSADWNELWAMLRVWAEHMKLKSLLLDVNAPALQEIYHARWDCDHDDPEVTKAWRAELPLTSNGQTIGRLVMSGHPEGEEVSRIMATVGKLLEDVEHAVGLLVNHGRYSSADGTAFPAVPCANDLADRLTAPS